MSAGPSAGDLAIAAAGGVVVLAALGDLFVTVFNYDGFSFLANRLHSLLWKLMRTFDRPLPMRQRHTALSLSSASMLPATVMFWLGLEITGFAMIYNAGLDTGALASHAGDGIGTAFYLSAGDISSLTFGDVIAKSGLMRALVDVETIIGLATFTLALGYVVTTFDVLRNLDGLHATVRRHAEDPTRTSSILARHFRGGHPSELPSLLESLTEKLEDYDQGLRRYPVVYYFHTRRLDRSIPRIFADLSRLLALLRWGLPAGEQMTEDPVLAALIDQYGVTLERLQRSFVGPPDLDPPRPLPFGEFADNYAAPAGAASDSGVDAFRELQQAACASAGISLPHTGANEPTYRQYREWLGFARRNHVVLSRVADALGYELAATSRAANLPPLSGERGEPLESGAS